MDVEFGPFRLRSSVRQVEGPAGLLELSARSFDILALLLARPDVVIDKAELLDTVWPGLVVEDNTLQVHVSALRKALGAGMVMTVHGRGYKYSGPRPVALSPDEAGAAGLDQTRHVMLDRSGSKTVPVTGGCLCGAIRYRITGPALDTNFCHCRMCQKFTGSPTSAGSVYAIDTVQITRGTPTYYKSSPFAERGFCAACGSSLFYRPLSPAVTPDWENWILVYIGTLDNPVPNAPTWHLGVESQMPWMTIQHAALRLRCQDSPDLVEAWSAFGLPVP